MRIVLAPAGSHGDVHPFVGLGKALKARGHEVHVVTAAPFRELVERAGLDGFHPVGTQADFDALTHDPDLWHPSRSLKVIYGNRGLIARQLRESYTHFAALYRPGRTVAAAGALAFGARVAQDKLGLPLATLQLQPAALLSISDPPVMANVRVPRWWPHWFRRAVLWFGDRVMIDRMAGPPLNDFRRELGLPPVTRIVSRWMNSPQRVINLFPDWFGSAPDWPPQTVQTGFVRYDQADLAPLPPAVEDFLAAGDPPVVFSFGSAMRLARPYFEAAVEACRILNRRGLLLAKGGDQIPPDLPPTVLHADYAPFSVVFPRCAVAVHHGGIGTSAQGLAAGVPQLVMPLAFDQPDNATRLERLGVTRWLWPRHFTGPAVAAALKELTGSTAVAAKCRELAARMAAHDPTADTCDRIESLAGSDRPAV